MTAPFHIRPIEPRDDDAVAGIIRAVMPEFGADGPGFAIHDPEVATMSAAYSGPRARYFVVEHEGRLMGGGGVAPLEGGGEQMCELRKMYFLPALRGLGAGRALMSRCLAAARELGFGQCYIETLAEMHAARTLYLGSGFTALDAPLGSTGHFGCNCWYLLDL